MPRPKEILWPRKIPILETARLTLRPLLKKDAAVYFRINSNKKIMETYGVHRHRTLAETQKLIPWLELEFKRKNFLRWGIQEKTKGELIDDIGFWRFVEPRARGEVAMKLLPEFWGQGYMTEALNRVLDYAFSELNLQSVEANVDGANKSSMKLMKKSGFSKMAIIPRHTYSDIYKTYVDTVLFNIHDEQWKKRCSRES